MVTRIIERGLFSENKKTYLTKHSITHNQLDAPPSNLTGAVFLTKNAIHVKKEWGIVLLIGRPTFGVKGGRGRLSNIRGGELPKTFQ